jgi:hypothetical protein
MSTYLLLRNNKESGPFTVEEIKGMPLKSYDLVWVVGKSAAWRYPGEITELKSFAPAVPEPFSEYFIKKPNSGNISPDSANTKKSDSSNIRSRENNSPRVSPDRSVYVNLPAEKKQAVSSPARMVYDAEPSPIIKREPAYDFSDLYIKQPSQAVLFSGKVLLIGTILLLFGAGIITGFFISDRRKFFSGDANHPQDLPAVRPAVLNNKKEFSPVLSPVSQNADVNKSASLKVNSIKLTNSISKGLISGVSKKTLKNVSNKKDSVVNQTASYSSLNFTDSLKKNTIGNTEILYQKIKVHPENYVNLLTGRYSTGLFGGISSFPITVTNNSPVMLDQVVVNVDYIQNNEKVFKTESISFNDLEPGETVTIKAPKSSRGIKIATRIHFVNSRQLNLSYSN